MLKSIRYMLLVALCLVATACDLSSKSGTSVDPTPTPSPTPGPNGCTDPQPSTYSGYSGGLNDITMLSPTDGWAVGSKFSQGKDQSLILHYDGQRWASVPSPTSPRSFSLSGIQMVSANEAWAIGGLDGVILHYVNGVWSEAYHAPTNTRVSPPYTPGLSSLVMLSATDGWAVGTFIFSSSFYPATLILHYNGRAWTPVDNSSSILNALDLNDISFASPQEGWAVGYYAAGGGAGSSGRMVHFKTGIWLAPTGAELSITDLIDNWTSVKLISPTEGWATGYTHDSERNEIPSLWRLHEGHWAAVGKSSGVRRIGLVSPTEWWGVGYGFCHYKDGQYTSMIPSDAARASLSAVAMISATEGWAVGGCFQSGQCEIWHYLNGTWSAYTDQ